MVGLARRIARFALTKHWPGYCPICERRVRFWALGRWYRDELICGRCGSIPRERALMRVIQTLYPNWRDLSVHESSPIGRGASKKLSEHCSKYIGSQYMPELPSGTSDSNGHVAQDLENQTFSNGEFDLVITQDVFEHLFHPDRAIVEIVRTLKPGGAHIMSVPIVNKGAPSKRRARIEGEAVIHLEEPQYHGNPVGDGKALVTVDWGYDIADYLTKASGHATTIYTIDDIGQGIRAEYLEIVVTRKSIDGLLSGSG